MAFEITLARVGIYILLTVAFGATCFVKGCSYQDSKYEAANVQYKTITKHIKEVERVEVPKVVERIKWLTQTEYKLIEEAKNETPNPTVCDLSSERVRRINQAATSNPSTIP